MAPVYAGSCQKYDSVRLSFYRIASSRSRHLPFVMHTHTYINIYTYNPHIGRILHIFYLSVCVYALFVLAWVRILCLRVYFKYASIFWWQCVRFMMVVQTFDKLHFGRTFEGTGGTAFFHLKHRDWNIHSFTYSHKCTINAQKKIGMTFWNGYAKYRMDSGDGKNISNSVHCTVWDAAEAINYI